MVLFSAFELFSGIFGYFFHQNLSYPTMPSRTSLSEFPPILSPRFGRSKIRKNEFLFIKSDKEKTELILLIYIAVGLSVEVRTWDVDVLNKGRGYKLGDKLGDKNESQLRTALTS